MIIVNRKTNYNYYKGAKPPYNPLQKIKRKKIRNLKKQRLLRDVVSLSRVIPLITLKKQTAYGVILKAN